MSDSEEKLEHNAEQLRWLKMRKAYRANQYNRCYGFQNLAMDMDGQLCIGMTHNQTWGYYSASYIESGGERLSTPKQWDMGGMSLDKTADLNMKTIHKGVRTV